MGHLPLVKGPINVSRGLIKGVPITKRLTRYITLIEGGGLPDGSDTLSRQHTSCIIFSNMQSWPFWSYALGLPHLPGSTDNVQRNGMCCPSL